MLSYSTPGRYPFWLNAIFTLPTVHVFRKWISTFSLISAKKSISSHHQSPSPSPPLNSTFGPGRRGSQGDSVWGCCGYCFYSIQFFRYIRDFPEAYIHVGAPTSEEFLYCVSTSSWDSFGGLVDCELLRWPVLCCGECYCYESWSWDEAKKHVQVLMVPTLRSRRRCRRLGHTHLFGVFG